MEINAKYSNKNYDNKGETTADKGGDIRSFKAARFGKGCPSLIPAKGSKIGIKDMCVVNLGTSYSCINESPYDPPYWNNNNCWAGAREACKDIGMSLASVADLYAIYGHKGEQGVPDSGFWFSSSESSPPNVNRMNFENGTVGASYLSKKDKSGALCVGN